MDPKTTPTQKREETAQWLFALSLAGQLGFMIALPIVAFALLGRLADREWGTSPLFLLAGAALAAVASSIWVIRRSKALRDRYMDVTGTPPRT